MPRTMSFRSRTTPEPLLVHFSKSGPGVVQAEISEQRPGFLILNSGIEAQGSILTGSVLRFDPRCRPQPTFVHFLSALSKIEFDLEFSFAKVVQQK